MKNIVSDALLKAVSVAFVATLFGFSDGSAAASVVNNSGDNSRPKRVCVQPPNGERLLECDCNWTLPPDYRTGGGRYDSNEEQAHSEMSAVRKVFGLGPAWESAEADALAVCTAAVKEFFIESGVSAAEADQYLSENSPLSDCRSYACGENFLGRRPAD